MVYCDIPYDTDMKKQHDERYTSDFDHQAFREWALSRDYPVYVSEYSMPKGFTRIASIAKRNTFNDRHNILRTEGIWVQDWFAKDALYGQLEIQF